MMPIGKDKATRRLLHSLLVAILLGPPLIAYSQPVGNGAAGDACRSESPYETVVRLRREAVAKRSQTPAGPGPQAAVSVGPVVATAQLKLVVPTRGSPVNLLGLRRYDTTLVRPAGLTEAPADVPGQPAYFVLQVGDREVAGITYRSNRYPGPVKLWLDTDGDGSFSDESQYVGTWLHWLYPYDSFQFGPVSTQHGGAAGKRGACYVQCSGGKWLTVHTAFYREGKVLLKGRAYRIALVDGDFDGRFDRSFVPPAVDSRDPGCDVLALDLNGDSEFNYEQPGASEIMPLSKLVKVDKDYYSLDVAEDGGTIEFREATPAFGILDLGGEQVVLGLWSDTAQQRLTGYGGTLRLPAGRYSMVTLELAEEDSEGRWTFQMAKGGAGPLKDFEIRPGATTAFKIGPPFQLRTSMQRYGQNPFVTVGLELEGQGGERYSAVAKVNGKEAPEPALKIIDGAGQVVHAGQFAYG